MVGWTKNIESETQGSTREYKPKNQGNAPWQHTETGCVSVHVSRMPSFLSLAVQVGFVTLFKWRRKCDTPNTRVTHRILDNLEKEEKCFDWVFNHCFPRLSKNPKCQKMAIKSTFKPSRDRLVALQFPYWKEYINEPYVLVQINFLRPSCLQLDVFWRGLHRARWLPKTA